MIKFLPLKFKTLRMKQIAVYFVHFQNFPKNIVKII